MHQTVRRSRTRDLKRMTPTDESTRLCTPSSLLSVNLCTTSRPWWGHFNQPDAGEIVDESAVTPENETASAKTSEEILCSNYSFCQSGEICIDQRTNIGLFDGPKPAVPQPPPPGQPRKRVEHFWSERDDLILKEAAEKYPNNWLLICDTFHSSRVTISTDRRTPWDCYERWKLRWESGKQVRLWIIAQSFTHR
jgi:Myb-like DNA-binding domain